MIKYLIKDIFKYRNTINKKLLVKENVNLLLRDGQYLNEFIGNRWKLFDNEKYILIKNENENLNSLLNFNNEMVLKLNKFKDVDKFIKFNINETYMAYANIYEHVNIIYNKNRLPDHVMFGWKINKN